jgi:uncharacterized membrane protein
MAAPAIAPAQRGLLARAGRLEIAIGVIALIGIAVAGYLTYIHYAGIEPLCAAGGGGCHKVQNSVYAELVGIPVAVLGLAGYLAIFGSLFLPGDLSRTTGAVLALSGFGFSAYLTYRELFTIDAICQWCVGSAILMTALAVLTTVRLLRE